MLFTLVAQLAVAGLAAAIPAKRQSVPNLSVQLSNTVSLAATQVNASTDGTAVGVDSDGTFDSVTVSCIEACIPEYHCELFDKSLASFLTVNPGTTSLDGKQVGQVICSLGLVEDTV